MQQAVLVVNAQLKPVTLIRGLQLSGSAPKRRIGRPAPMLSEPDLSSQEAESPRDAQNRKEECPPRRRMFQFAFHCVRTSFGRGTSGVA
jgi:hypothetical protein